MRAGRRRPRQFRRRGRGRADAEKPIFTLGETDAMAWAVTTIPANLKVTIRGVHALRRNGIPPTGPMGRS